MRQFLTNGKVRVGLVILGGFLLLALVGPWLVSSVLGTDPHRIDYDALGVGPGADHLLGTTSSGQDVLAQLLTGCRGSVEVGLLSGVLAVGVAALIGVTGGFLGGRTDQLLTAVTNIFATLPSLPLMLIVAGYMTRVDSVVIALLIGLFEWPVCARYLRAQTLSLRGRDFVQALRMVGESRWRMVLVEIMPHLSGVLSSLFLRAVVTGVFAEAGLRFLGIGGGDSVTWGTMIAFAQQQDGVLRGMWWWFVPPGLFIALLGTATALVNFGLDEIGNPVLRHSGRAAIRRARAHLAARRDRTNTVEVTS
ncbi:ABC transporter permease [Streptomyces sp. NBC_01387]|uniref:ABC transporter permease n=1 Tax=unclassified Streptomyces TaxID=2593676 RepID=UPI00224D391E|nr:MULTISPECIES: ABC transporter permease [unclassified Streptomyces]MCX4552878.1 ABC transporter permease [Streptomyces sp. NBC_01500]WSC24208.1 ABC transporter permease [Streptomyces sp. NBC_01766]WSV58094.1 ABC transporter permease [Streptomyces sp. NBC_01014]